MSELPDSWIDTKLGEVINYGSTIKVEPNDIADDAWILELEDVEKDSSKIADRFTFAERKSKSTKNSFAKGDVLYGKLRPYLNKVVMADKDGYCTTEIIPIKPTPVTDNRFVFYWLKHPTFLDYAAEVSHGLNMPRLGTDAGKNAPFVLAPLAEQKRIADKLDALLARVDAVRSRLDRIPTLLKHFRQSVLAAATTGQLTEDWRIDNRISMEGTWSDKSLGNFSSDISYGYTASSTSSNVGPKFLRITDIQDGAVNWLEVPYCQIEKKKVGQYLLQRGDLVFARTGATVGKSFLIRETPFESVFASYLIRVRCDSSNSIEYLSFFFQSNEYWSQITEFSAGVAQPSVNGTKLKELRVPLPGIEEQKERDCQTNCVTTEFQSAPSGTRSSPNITWKLCSAGFQ